MSQLTDQQNAALTARGNVLVAAGAGTGKTHTVTARCLDLILREGCSVENILMVTFTEAAAAEMRDRIRKALHAEAAKAAPESEAANHLADQIALLETAPISTLHSFCLELVRRNFHALGLDPQFTVLDESQTRPLIHAVLNELFERHYAAGAPVSDPARSKTVTPTSRAGGRRSEAVRELIRHYGNSSDAGIRELVLQIHRHAQTLAAPETWFAAQLTALNQPTPAAWRNSFIAGVAEWAQLWREAVAANAADCTNVATSLAALNALPANATFAAGAAALEKIAAADAEWKHGTIGKFRKPLEKFFDDAAFLLELARDGGAALAQDWEWTRRHMTALLELAREFTADFTRAKRELGGINFADQEQLALRLLYDDAGQLTPVARACRERFRFVFVDECQDINAAQDAILRAVSRDSFGVPPSGGSASAPPEGGTPNGANRFLVGDVKQSIYRFRLADPRIFQNYEREWSANGLGRAGSPLPAVRPTINAGAHGVTRPTTSGRVLPLSENFRSREALLNFINPLFRVLMRPVIGGLHYDADAELQFGDRANRAALAATPTPSPRPSGERAGVRGSEPETKAPPHPSPLLHSMEEREKVSCVSAETAAALQAWNEVSPRVELHIITKDSDAESAEPDAAPEAGEKTTSKTSDLPDLQATEREARLIARRLRELKDSNHQVWDKDKKEFRAVEFRDMVVLLRGVAGRAEIFAKAFHQFGVPLHAARAGFLDAIEVADLLNLLRLLDNPLQDVPLLAVLRSPFVGLSAAELVAVRLAHRDGLLWFALQKTSAGLSPKVKTFLTLFHRWRELVRHSSLTHCLETALTETHYEALLRAGERGAERATNVRRLVDLARRFDPFQREGLFRFLRFIAEQEEAGVRHEPAAAISENAVRLVTIHASKGLEFPVVVLAGLGAKFNARDLSADILLDAELGLCPKVLPPESRRRYPSAAHWLAAQREKRALLGEEMRLLYVALTRAKDTLILTGTASKKDEAARWREPATVTNHALLKAAGPLDWLRLWFAQSVQPESWSGENAGANELLRWEFHDPLAASFALDANANTSAGAAAAPAPTAEELAALKKILATRYAHTAATHEPAKASVSALRRRATEADAEANHLFVSKVQSPRSKAGKLSAAEIGTAHHAFLQLVEISRTATMLDLRNQATTLGQAGALSAAQAAALDFGALEAFWQSDFGQRLRTLPSETIHREMPFTARMSAAELRALSLLPAETELAGDEFVVVQGVADLAVLLPEEIWLVDFKTDAVDTDGLKEKVRGYAPQLRLYAQALAGIYRRPVTHCALHFLAARATVAVNATAIRERM